MKFHRFLCSAVFAVLPLSVVFGADDIPKAVAVPSENKVEAKATSKSSGTPIEKMKSAVRPLNVTVDLNNGSPIAGTLVEVDVLLIKTAFGEASVPLSEIAGIRFPQGDDVSTSVVMLNGDSITGATDIKMVTIETDWGVAKVNGSSIRSILFVPNLQWSSASGISGKRWGLQDAKAATPSPAQPGSTNNSGSATGGANSTNQSTILPSNGNRGPFFSSPQ